MGRAEKMLAADGCEGRLDPAVGDPGRAITCFA